MRSKDFKWKEGEYLTKSPVYFQLLIKLNYCFSDFPTLISNYPKSKQKSILHCPSE